MDPPDPSGGGGRGGGGGGGGRRRKFLRFLIRCFFSILSSLAVSFLFSFFFGLVAIAIGSFSASQPVSVPARCRIISSSVDLRSSKVCELGVLNYKAKHVFYPMEKTRFRCRDDYYWASIFKVEYEEHFSGQTLHAVAEAPEEALPLDCRPSFGTALMTKTKFKVNETYSCRYTPGTDKADIYPYNFFDCQAKDPSMVEMSRRFFILFIRSNFSFNKGRAGPIVYAVAGIVAGMLLAMCTVILIKTLQVSALKLSRQWDAWKLRIAVFAARFRRACVLVAYVSAMGWLTLQYGKMVGLKKLFFDSHFGETTI